MKKPVLHPKIKTIKTLQNKKSELFLENAPPTLVKYQKTEG